MLTILLMDLFPFLHWCTVKHLAHVVILLRGIQGLMRPSGSHGYFFLCPASGMYSYFLACVSITEFLSPLAWLNLCQRFPARISAWAWLKNHAQRLLLVVVLEYSTKLHHVVLQQIASCRTMTFQQGLVLAVVSWSTPANCLNKFVCLYWNFCLHASECSDENTEKNIQ